MTERTLIEIFFLDKISKIRLVLFETLDSFTQIDANVQYQLNDRWEIFLRGKNLMNQNQYFWSNYRVYPSQISLGLKYNFDVSF